MCVEYYYIDVFLNTYFQRNFQRILTRNLEKIFASNRFVPSSNLDAILERSWNNESCTSFIENRFDSLANDLFVDHHTTKQTKKKKSCK